MRDKEIKEQLSLRYEQDLENQRLRYENERQQRLRREMDANYRVQQDIKEEEAEKLRRKRELMAKQYNEYLKGQEYKHEKMLKEVQEKLEPTLVSLPLNSDARLRQFKERIEKMSEKNDINGKLYDEFKAKNRATSHYNILTKRYSLDNKVVSNYPDEKNLTQPPKLAHNTNLSEINFQDNINVYKDSDNLQYQQQANFNYISNEPNNNDINYKTRNNVYDNYRFVETTGRSSNDYNNNNNINIQNSKSVENINSNINTNINSNLNLNSNLYQQPKYTNNSIYVGVPDKKGQSLLYEGGRREGTDVTNNAYFDHYYNITYPSYKEINKQYEDYNKSLVAQNQAFKNEMALRRKEQEEIRRLERERLSKMQQLQKMYDDDLKRQYRQYLDQQVVQQLPRKLMDEGYTKEALAEGTPMFQNEYLYVNAPDYNLINKSKFVEVNPYNPKKYDLGETILQNNTILNPAFNYRYNRYIVPLNKEMREGENILRSSAMNLMNK